MGYRIRNGDQFVAGMGQFGVRIASDPARATSFPTEQAACQWLDDNAPDLWGDPGLVIEPDPTPGA